MMARRFRSNYRSNNEMVRTLSPRTDATLLVDLDADGTLAELRGKCGPGPLRSIHARTSRRTVRIRLTLKSPAMPSPHEASALPRVSGKRNAASPMSPYAITAKIAMARDSGIVAEM